MPRKFEKYGVKVKIPKYQAVMPFLVWAPDREKAKDCAYFHAKKILSEKADEE